MKIIPVIDLKHGQVVHARFGQRQKYQPIQSLLCNSSKPIDIINALLELYPFNTLYIADIDAIQGDGSHFEMLTELVSQFENVNFWLDCGIRQMNHRALHYQHNIRPVIGSENMENLISYKAVSYGCNSRHVLSLDYNEANPQGTKDLHVSAKYWPEDTICMSLSHVGSGLGVDLEKLNSITALNAQRKVPSRLYAAGGVRYISDCVQLKEMGLTGVLIASALHNQAINARQIADFYQQ